MAIHLPTTSTTSTSASSTKQAPDIALQPASYYIASETPASPLTTPTPDGSGEAIHPSVVHIPGGWNGYAWWMAMTPYPAADATEENPCILCSHDGDTWVEPTGITNPIYDWPGGSDYNSDTDLVMDGNTMWCIWREVRVSSDPDDEAILGMSSTDGVTWNGPTVLISAPMSTRRVVSPTVWWDDTAGSWVMVGIDIVPNPNVMFRATAPTIDGTWTVTTAPTVTGAPQTGRDLWHIHARPVRDGVIAVLNDCTLNASGTNGDLYIMTSDDAGQTWTASDTKLVMRCTDNWDEVLYRACIVPHADGAADMFYSANNGSNVWHTGRAKMTLQPPQRYSDDVVAAVNGINPWVLGDRFRRADSASSVGSLDTGQAWTVTSGTWGISSNAAYLTAATNGKLRVDPGISDLYMECQALVWSGSQWWLNFRISTETNYWRAGADNYGGTLQKIVAGVVTGFYVFPVVDGDRMCVWAEGDVISAGVNGQKRITVTDSAFQTSTTVGLQCNNTSQRFRNFIVREPI